MLKVAQPCVSDPLAQQLFFDAAKGQRPRPRKRPGRHCPRPTKYCFFVDRSEERVHPPSKVSPQNWGRKLVPWVTLFGRKFLLLFLNYTFPPRKGGWVRFDHLQRGFISGRGVSVGGGWILGGILGGGDLSFCC